LVGHEIPRASAAQDGPAANVADGCFEYAHRSAFDDCFHCVFDVCFGCAWAGMSMGFSTTHCVVQPIGCLKRGIASVVPYDWLLGRHDRVAAYFAGCIETRIEAKSMIWRRIVIT
jgi:hypothetical protein